VIDSRHDTGTDLYLRPRDSRRYELGAVMGAQVKTGPSYFGSPQRTSDGTVTGWWFAEDHREHFDYWLRHALPHVVILRDQETNLSHWVHVTDERVLSTGKGAKILIPATQVVDKNHNEALSDIALTQLPTPTWNGSAWTGAVHLLPKDEIRHALITPRLIAPHPNLRPESITGLEALAMQVLLRGELEQVLIRHQLDEIMQDDGAKWKGLALSEALKSPDWCWRATAALHLRYYQGDPAELLRLSESASCPNERAASTILRCTYHFDENDADAAVEVLEEALTHDDYTPVDQAWLEAQLARARLEVGQHVAAFDLAMRAQRIHREAPSDVTAAAIAGACALTSFRANSWMRGSFANIIERGDNPASWWRAQIMSYGLSAHLNAGFRTWSQDKAVRIGGSDTAQKKLLSAAMVSSFAADHDGWRSATGSLAEHLLISTSSTDNAESVAHSLSLLRLGGNSKNVSQATRHLVRRGPTIAVRMAAETVDLARSTRTTALADLELLSAAGDVLDSTQADEICSWALAKLRDPRAYLERARPTFFVEDKVIQLLASMVWALSDDALHTVLDYFLGQPPVTDHGTAQTLARLIHSVPQLAWCESDRRRAAGRKGDAAYLREAFLAVAAPSSAESREQVLERARAGDLLAFEAIADVTTLPADAVDTLSERLCSVVDTLIKNADRGVSDFGGLDPARALTLLGVWHPSRARWDRIENLITAPGIGPQQIVGCLQVLAAHGQQLDLAVKSQLAGYVTALRHRTLGPNFFGEDEDIRSFATEALAALTDQQERKALVRELVILDAAHRTAESVKSNETVWVSSFGIRFRAG